MSQVRNVTYVSRSHKFGNGRRERIRTSGPYVPNVVLYQAELLSDIQPWPLRNAAGGGGGSALIAMRPTPRNRAETLVRTAILPVCGPGGAGL